MAAFPTMIKNFKTGIVLHVLLLLLITGVSFFVYFQTAHPQLALAGLILIVWQTARIIKFIDRTNKTLTQFINAIKYSDFSVSFPTDSAGGSFDELNGAMQEVMENFRKTRAEKEATIRYLQTVVEHIGIGLLSFNQAGKIEFINNAAKKIARVSTAGTMKALAEENKQLSDILLNIKAGSKEIFRLDTPGYVQQLFIYATEFKMFEENHKLVTLQNIDNVMEEQEMEAWQKLIRVLTHEIMNSITPISSLAGTMQTMLREDDETLTLSNESLADLKLAINSIQKRSEGLIHFVENYRNLTHVAKPNFQIISVEQLFSRITSLMGNELAVKNIVFIRTIAPESLEITADPELIEQVLINLLRNSIQALEGRIEPQIKLTAKLDERGKILVQVCDNGPGINEDALERIFIPFFSTKRDGSGIGLSLSRQIMRSHGGTIRASSIPDKETIFSLRF